LCLGILGALDPVFAELPRLALVAAFLFVPASAMLQALFGVAQGARAPVLGQVPNLVIRPLVMALMIVVLVAARGRDAMDASATLIAEVVASIVAVACAMALIRRNLGRRPGALEDSRTLRRALNAAPALLVLSLAQMLIWYAGQLALGLTASPVEVGAYSAAARLTMLIAIAITAVNSIVAPRIAELYFRREMRSLDRLVAQAAAVSTAIALPAACVLVLGGKWLLNLLGTGFSQGYPVLVALTLGQCVNAATGSVLYVMTMTGHERQAAILVGVTACVNLLVCLTLASVFGATSVAVATACAIALWNLAAVRWVRTNIGLECALRLSKRIRFA
jgi:O-antigen/teichoic acid export membrane protein